ncbi:MAG: organoarsenical effux MFS transporter ArsJ [bacterium]
MTLALRHYFLVTGGYWAFTLTDGAIRMLVVLYFHQLGYSPFEVAMLFLFYEFFGIVTNLLGGWLAARVGLNVTMHLGMILQVIALLMLTVPEAWLGVIYVMFAQALSGIAKDLNKMSAKASVKTLISDTPDANGQSPLFKWVAILTGSKNALKGVGFFLGAFLLTFFGFQLALFMLAGGLFIIFLLTFILLPKQLGKSKAKAKFKQVFSPIAAINWLSAARFFLFGARDVWFVVALPVFLHEQLHWDFMTIGGFMALWVIAYGIVQAATPRLMRGNQPNGLTAQVLAVALSLIPAMMAYGLMQVWTANIIIVVGLVIFGIIFAINSAVHSYLILSYADHDKVAMNVGFYYMANAGGRLAGTVLSGLSYQYYGMIGSLWFSVGFLLLAALLSTKLPRSEE